MADRADETVGQRVGRLRDRLLLTQSGLSLASEVPLPTIKDIERGRTQTPHVATLRRLAEALRVEPEYLRFGDTPAGQRPQ